MPSNFEYERKLRIGFVGAGDLAYRVILPAFQYAPIDLVALATVDALTNVYNRRRFVQEQERELEKSKRLGETMALLWLDLDNFKRVNDTY